MLLGSASSQSLFLQLTITAWQYTKMTVPRANTNRSWRALGIGLLLVLSAVAAPSSAHAVDTHPDGAADAMRWPQRSIRFLIPFPPGGPTDIVGRLVAERLARVLMVPVVSDNRPGAGGNLGTEQCAHAPADGYTLCMISIAQCISASVVPNLGFDPVRDFSHVSLLATLPSVLVVNTAVPVDSLKSLITYARAHPGKLNYASGGSGTSSQLLMEMFKLQAAIDMVHVPYKGTGPALLDQVSGSIDAAFFTAISVGPYLKLGKLRAIAVSTRERMSLLPNVPTLDESGLPGFDGGSWQGAVMPAGVAREIVYRMNAALVMAVRGAEVNERILSLGGLALTNSPEEFQRYMQAERDKWAQVVHAAGVTMQ